MITGGYGQMRATDADRDRVHGVLQAAYADGRLTWDEFEARSGALMNAKTHGEIAPLTADLRLPVAYQAPVSVPGGTSQLAIASLLCGIFQFPFWLVSGIPAIVLGHMARREIRRTGQQGAGLAMTGLVLGYIGLLLAILTVIAIVVGVSWLSGHAPPPPPTSP
jgi:uncharacterized protein DUF4190/uncharacterized protein DUF1707